MFNRTKMAFIVVLALAAAAMFTSLAYAGGWVVITLDALPQDVVAGEPTTIGMTARQHGRTPWEVESLQIRATHVETDKTLDFTALPDNKAPGHYTAELLLPYSGQWEWGVSAGMFPDAQPMPELDVAANPAVVAEATGTGSSLMANSLTALLGIGALLAFALGVVMIVRSDHRRSPMLAGVGLIILCAGLAFASYSSATVQAKQAVPATGAAVAGVQSPEEAQAALGQQLFLAKGCVVCHTNDRAIKVSESYGINFGPNLTKYKNDPTYLHTLLKDPKAIRPNAEMPNLELKKHEIEALVAFINDHE